MRQLRTGQLTYHELSVFIRTSGPGTAYARQVLGEDSAWDLRNQLLAGIYDQLAAANWQRSGGKGPRPKPLPRPGVTNGSAHYGKTKMRGGQVAALLAQASGRQIDESWLTEQDRQWVADQMALTRA